MLISPLIDPFALHNVAEDTSPQLGGDLDVNGKEIKFATNDFLGWWSGAQRKSYITGVDSCLDLVFFASDSIHFYAGGDAGDFILFKTVGSLPEITTSGGCNLKVSPSGGLLDIIGKLAISNQSRCRVIRANSAQSIPSGGWHKVELNSTQFDQLSEWSGSPNYRFTATDAGYYLICFSAGFRPPLSADKKYIVGCFLNGVSHAVTMLHSSHNDYIGGGNAIISYLEANDYVELKVSHNSGGAVNLDYDQELTFLAIERLS